MKKVGHEGVITVEEARSIETELEVVEGKQFDRGYVSPYFVTNAEKMRVEMEDPYILSTRGCRSSYRCLKPWWRKASYRGGALLRASETLNRVRTHNDDQKTGIVRKALSWPTRQIALNAGEDGSIMVGKILEKDTYGYGFDAQSGEYVNMMSRGIIDPTKVVRAALQDAASVAGLLITTEAMVAERPKKESPAMPSRGMGVMGGMDY
jgi:chaperonin GroEL (HSP60 family)